MLFVIVKEINTKKLREVMLSATSSKLGQHHWSNGRLTI
jgi:hypothetical protein